MPTIMRNQHLAVVHKPDGGCLYVDKTHRRCNSEISESCVNHSDLRCGHISTFATPTVGKVYSVCNKCRVEEKKLAVTKRTGDTANGIIKMMEAMIKRPVAGSNGPSFTEFANQLVSKMGGIESTSNKTADVLSEILDNEESRPKDKLEAVGRITQILSLLHRTKQDPIDISSLDIETLTDDIKKYAKELVLTSAEFRAELLADPDVREMLLNEAGVTVIEAETNTEFEQEYQL